MLGEKSRRASGAALVFSSFWSNFWVEGHASGTLLAIPSILEHTPDGGRRREKDASSGDQLEYPN
jgi:hypothetical protein